MKISPHVDKRNSIKNAGTLATVCLLILEYFLAASSMVFFIYFSFIHKEYGYIYFFTKFKFLYLTNMFLILSLATVFLGLLRRVFSNLTNLYLNFLTVAVCCEFIVVAGFWTAFFISPNLLRHGASAKGNAISAISELPKHLFPFITLLIEQYKVQIVFSVYHLFVTALFFLLFGVANEFLINYNDVCLYPIFRKLNYIQRIGLYFLMIVVISLINLGYALIKDKGFRTRSCDRLTCGRE